jgi:hypothetical protein
LREPTEQARARTNIIARTHDVQAMRFVLAVCTAIETRDTLALLLAKHALAQVAALE